MLSDASGMKSLGILDGDQHTFVKLYAETNCAKLGEATCLNVRKAMEGQLNM